VSSSEPVFVVYVTYFIVCIIIVIEYFCKLYLCFNSLTLTVAVWVHTCEAVPDRVKPSFVNFDIRALRRSAMSVRTRMSKITNDGLTRSGTGCVIA